MAAQNHVPSFLLRTTTVSALTLAAVGGTLMVPGGSPDASAATIAARAVQIAASKRGSPYRWGAIGPHSFDCSGLAQYSFKKAGRQIPRTTQLQYNDTRHVSSSRRRRGDLVFFHYGSSVYHVGIYAGHGRIWHAPKTGAVVRLEKIWDRSVWYGRVF
jgi:cell wall-associated NlpC family hydrolase